MAQVTERAGNEAAFKSQLNMDDAAELLGWSPTHLRRLIGAGELRIGFSKDTVLWEDVRRLALRDHRMTLLTTEADLNGDAPPPWIAIGTTVALGQEKHPEDYVRHCLVLLC